MHASRLLAASLRYRRPYWMLFLKNVDNWRIYTVIQQPDHQRTEMLYQAWLGGLDRPYVRPKCMAHQPLWLSKKRHAMRRSRLDNPESPLEKYVLEWQRKFNTFQGKERPTPDDLHTALDLVERPLDLSYALQLFSQCRNLHNIRFEDPKETFVVFLEACLRVDRKDCAVYALENAAKLGFSEVDENCSRYLKGEQTWYKQSVVDGLFYPLEENAERNAAHSTQGVAGSGSELTGGAEASRLAGPDGVVADEDTAASLDEDILRLQAELEALERESQNLK